MSDERRGPRPGGAPRPVSAGPQHRPASMQASVEAARSAPPPVVVAHQKPIEEQSGSVREPAALGSEWERVSLPSGFIPYEWQDLHVKSFEPMDQARLARAVRHKNLSLVLDVLNACSTRDVRDLVPADFRALCIWHKLHDWLSTPSNITWTSRYGNRASVQVRRTRVVETPLQLSREEYLRDCRESGLVLPAMRDAELLETISDEDALYLFERSRFVDPAPLSEQIARLRRAGDRAPSVTARIEEFQRRARSRSGPSLSVMNEVDEFSEKWQSFGVEEIADVTDPKFDPSRAPEYAAYLEESADALDASGPEDARRAALVASMREEAADLRAASERGTPPAAREEEVPLAFSLWTMFPYT